MRAPKNQRKPDPGGFRLKPRDRQIIKAVNDCQVLLSSQIERWFFNSKSPAQARLRKLYDNGYLERHFVTVAATAPETSPILYSVTQPGAYLLAQYFEYTPDDFRFPGEKLLNNWLVLQHLIAVNDFRMAVSRALDDQGWTLNYWLDEIYFRSDPDLVKVGSSRKSKPVYPDGFFHITVPQGQARFLLEVDRGTEGTRSLRPQIEVYREYVDSGLYQERFEARSLRILIVTTSPKRIETFKRVIRGVGGFSNYWLTTMNQISPETVLTAPIWQRLNSPDTLPLIEGT